MKQRSQELRILDHLRRYGHITNRVAMEYMKINNPFARIQELRELIRIHDFFVKAPNGKRFKIFYISRSKAENYAKRNKLQIAV